MAARIEAGRRGSAAQRLGVGDSGVQRRQPQLVAKGRQAGLKLRLRDRLLKKGLAPRVLGASDAAQPLQLADDAVPDVEEVGGLDRREGHEAGRRAVPIDLITRVSSEGRFGRLGDVAGELARAGDTLQGSRRAPDVAEHLQQPRRVYRSRFEQACPSLRFGGVGGFPCGKRRGHGLVGRVAACLPHMLLIVSPACRRERCLRGAMRFDGLSDVGLVCRRCLVLVGRVRLVAVD